MSFCLPLFVLCWQSKYVRWRQIPDALQHMVPLELQQYMVSFVICVSKAPLYDLMHNSVSSSSTAVPPHLSTYFSRD